MLLLEGVVDGSLFDRFPEGLWIREKDRLLLLGGVVEMIVSTTGVVAVSVLMAFRWWLWWLLWLRGVEVVVEMYVMEDGGVCFEGGMLLLLVAGRMSRGVVVVVVCTRDLFTC